MKSKIYIALTSTFLLCAYFKSFSQANISLSNLASTTAVNHSLVPGATNVVSLGSGSITWKNLYLGRTIYINGAPALSSPLNSNSFGGYNAGGSSVTGTFNTAFGSQALKSITAGSSNAAFGYNALYNTTTGFANVGIGAGALYNITTNDHLVAIGDSALFYNSDGTRNTAVGSLALYKNTTGENNTAEGYQALYANTIGNSNIAEGYQALYLNTTGSNNVANGTKALYSNTTGYSNIAVGIKALYSYTGFQSIGIGDSALYSSTSQNNLAIGSKALYNVVTGANNLAIGGQTLYNNTAGFNIGVGYSVLHENTTGTDNAGFGFEALYDNTVGNNNTGLGLYALVANIIGSNNTATGAVVLLRNTTGSNNAAYGADVLENNTSGSDNTAIGDEALASNITGYSNVAIGTHALYFSPTASNQVAVGDSALLYTGAGFNTAIGSKALTRNVTGAYHTALGYHALFANAGTNYSNVAVGESSLESTSDGSYNVGVGTYSLSNNVSGTENTAIGQQADVSSGVLSNATAIGFDAYATASNTVFLGNGSVSAVEAYGPYMNISDSRVKKNIKEDVPGLEFIKQLRPVTYNYDIHEANNITGLTALQNQNIKNGDKPSPDKALASDKANQDAISAKEKKIYTGFVAQEVEIAAKKLNYDFSGVHHPQNEKDLYGLSYSDFVVPLVKAVQELSKLNDNKQQQIDSLKNELAGVHKDVAQLKAIVLNSGTNISAADNSTSKTISLSSALIYQNVPNPFSNLTTINYSLPSGYTNASIVITDKSGKTLKTVTLNGSYSGIIKVETSTLSAGAYQYSLYVNNKLVDTKQMILTR